MSKTIPEDQIAMVLVGLRFLEIAIDTNTLDEEDRDLIEGDGGTLPDVKEISALRERLDAEDEGDAT
jgi:hypothetical protein